ncbi:MAG: Integral membrane protein, partial [uncultured Frankineae bacterium]
GRWYEHAGPGRDALAHPRADDHRGRARRRGRRRHLLRRTRADRRRRAGRPGARRRRAGGRRDARPRRRGRRAGAAAGPRHRHHGRQLGLHLGPLAGHRPDAALAGAARPDGLPPAAQRDDRLRADGPVRLHDLPRRSSTAGRPRVRRHHHRAVPVLPRPAATGVRQPVRRHAQPARRLGPARRHGARRRRGVAGAADRRSHDAGAHGCGDRDHREPLRARRRRGCGVRPGRVGRRPAARAPSRRRAAGVAVCGVPRRGGAPAAPPSASRARCRLARRWADPLAARSAPPAGGRAAGRTPAAPRLPAPGSV